MEMCVLVSQSCLTICNPTDCSPTGSSVHGILQARILEWVATPFSRRSSWPRDRILVSCMAGRFFTIWATGKSFILETTCLFSVFSSLKSFQMLKKADQQPPSAIRAERERKEGKTEGKNSSQTHRPNEHTVGHIHTRPQWEKRTYNHSAKCFSV